MPGSGARLQPASCNIHDTLALWCPLLLNIPNPNVLIRLQLLDISRDVVYVKLDSTFTFVF